MAARAAALAVGDAIEQLGGSFELGYETVLVTARRR